MCKTLVVFDNVLQHFCTCYLMAFIIRQSRPFLSEHRFVLISFFSDCVLPQTLLWHFFTLSKFRFRVFRFQLVLNVGAVVEKLSQSSSEEKRTSMPQGWFLRRRKKWCLWLKGNRLLHGIRAAMIVFGQWADFISILLLFNAKEEGFLAVTEALRPIPSLNFLQELMIALVFLILKLIVRCCF